MEIYTIGHSNYTMERLIDMLEYYNINCVVDIRGTPYSKYNIQFEKEEQVRKLYEKLKGNDLYREYEYKDSKGEVKYTSYQLQFNDVSLIVSSTIDNVQPDFQILKK